MKQVAIFCVLSVFLFTGCRGIGGSIRVDGGYPHGHNMPPAHAPAHGRRHHSYHYYPSAEFYFDVGRNMYFYLDSRGQWSFSVSLPHHLRTHLHSGYVEIEMESAKPYSRHKYHKNKYKKHKYKSSKKKNRNKHKKYRDDDHDEKGRGRGRY